MAEVKFESVSKRFGDVPVVDNLDLVLPDGELVVLVGPSGCGKTTTLRMLAGLETTTHGRIMIGDREITNLEPNKRDVAMVFQNYALYPHLSVLDNIAFPLKAKGISKQDRYERAKSAANTLALSELLSRRPKDLSGGQQQRVAIARATVRNPMVFLFDEPLSNLDAKLRVEMRSEILRIQRSVGTTSLYVTHDQEEAMTLSDTMVVMRDGRIEQIGSPVSIYSTPVSIFVAKFVGSPTMNLFTGEVTDRVIHTDLGSEINIPGVPMGRHTIGVRPEHVKITPLGQSAPEASVFLVEIIELLGPRAIVSLTSVRSGEKAQAVVEASELAEISSGTKVTLTIKPGTVHRFDLESGRRLADFQA